jgi:hypothetical protein
MRSVSTVLSKQIIANYCAGAWCAKHRIKALPAAPETVGVKRKARSLMADDIRALIDGVDQQSAPGARSAALLASGWAGRIATPSLLVLIGRDVERAASSPHRHHFDGVEGFSEPGRENRRAKPVRRCFPPSTSARAFRLSVCGAHRQISRQGLLKSAPMLTNTRGEMHINGSRQCAASGRAPLSPVIASPRLGQSQYLSDQTREWLHARDPCSTLP